MTKQEVKEIIFHYDFYDSEYDGEWEDRKDDSIYEFKTHDIDKVIIPEFNTVLEVLENHPEDLAWIDNFSGYLKYDFKKNRNDSQKHESRLIYRDGIFYDEYEYIQPIGRGALLTVTLQELDVIHNIIWYDEYSLTKEDALLSMLSDEELNTIKKVILGEIHETTPKEVHRIVSKMAQGVNKND